VYPATEEAMHAKAKTDARRAWLLTLCKCRTRRRSLKLVEVPALTKSAIRFSTMRLKLFVPYLEVYPQKEILVNEKWALTPALTHLTYAGTIASMEANTINS
jgi:hypothetical protein